MPRPASEVSLSPRPFGATMVPPCQMMPLDAGDPEALHGCAMRLDRHRRIEMLILDDDAGVRAGGQRYGFPGFQSGKRGDQQQQHVAPLPEQR